jgi:hypothetical protein
MVFTSGVVGFFWVFIELNVVDDAGMKSFDWDEFDQALVLIAVMLVRLGGLSSPTGSTAVSLPDVRAMARRIADLTSPDNLAEVMKSDMAAVKSLSLICFSLRSQCSEWEIEPPGDLTPSSFTDSAAVGRVVLWFLDKLDGSMGDNSLN